MLFDILLKGTGTGAFSSNCHHKVGVFQHTNVPNFTQAYISIHAFTSEILYTDTHYGLLYEQDLN